MKKKYYLEAIRILAVLFVIINHSALFLNFAKLKYAEYAVSFGLTLLCKMAVPLFYMVSGVVLLGKNESFRELFQKRILRIIVVLVLFSLFFHLLQTARGETAFDPLGVLLGLPFREIYLPYWYLYSYLAMLLLMPMLRPLAQNMSKKTLYYLIGMMIVFNAGKLAARFFEWQPLCEWFDISGFFRPIIFYPLVGFGLDRYVEETHFFDRNNMIRNAVCVAAAIMTWFMVCGQYREEGVYSETYLWTWMPMLTMVCFLDMKILFREERLTENVKKVLSLAGSCVFGIYLLDMCFGPTGKMDVIYKTLMPFTGYLIAFLIEIFCTFLIRLALTWVMKKMPVLRRLL